MQRCIVLDIEGTTTPISFVADVLFPYARDNVGRHLYATYETAETQDDIKLLRSQVRTFFVGSFECLHFEGHPFALVHLFMLFIAIYLQLIWD